MASPIAQILKDNPIFVTKSKTGLLLELRTKYGISKKSFDDFLENDPAAQRLPFMLEQVPSRNSVKKNAIQKVIAHPSYSFQVDVVLAGWKYGPRKKDRFLMMVEVNSRKVFVHVLSSNTGKEVSIAYKTIMDGKVIPQIPLFPGEPNTKAERVMMLHVVHGDKFFDNKLFREANDAYGILVSATVAADDHKSRTGNALGLIDRAVKTIKQMLWRKYQATNDRNWPSYLEAIVDEDNKSPHSSLKGETPNQMYQDRLGLAEMWQKNSEHNEGVNVAADNSKFPVGTNVRLVVKKGPVEKGGATLSPQVYVVLEGGSKTTYRLKNVKTGDELKRRPRLNDVVRVSSIAQSFTVPRGSKDTGKQERALRREGLV
jgi:hypothetical protein